MKQLSNQVVTNLTLEFMFLIVKKTLKLKTRLLPRREDHASFAPNSSRGLGSVALQVTR